MSAITTTCEVCGGHDKIEVPQLSSPISLALDGCGVCVKAEKERTATLIRLGRVLADAAMDSHHPKRLNCHICDAVDEFARLDVAPDKAVTP